MASKPPPSPPHPEGPKEVSPAPGCTVFSVILRALTALAQQQSAQASAQGEGAEVRQGGDEWG